MTNEPNLLFRALDAAGGRRDGEFIRALADLVDAGRLLFEPDVEYSTPGAAAPDSDYVNINWAFAVPADWLAAWAADMHPTVSPR